MHRYDFSPLFRSSVGFDRLQFLLDSARQKEGEAALAYPPYDIAVTGDGQYRITMAVPGFDPADLDVQVEHETLQVSGRRQARDTGELTYLHRGIQGQDFERRFELAEHIRVVGANLDKGLLTIDLERVIPEEKKPRKIDISSL
ncbi:MAG: Hsp20 family protein [Hyphomicrobiales bacterium]|nr:Hsp20 family protein [Hyphomicrobiales bacterium]